MSTTNATRPLVPAWLESDAMFQEKPLGVFYVSPQDSSQWYIASPRTSLAAARAELLERDAEDIFNFRKTVYFHCDLSRLNLINIQATQAPEDIEARVTAARKDGYALLSEAGVIEIGLHRSFVRGKKALFRMFRNREDLRYFLAELIDSASPSEDNAGARFLKTQRDRILRELEKIESERNTLRQLENFIADREELLNRRAEQLSRHGVNAAEDVDDIEDLQEVGEARPPLWN